MSKKNSTSKDYYRPHKSFSNNKSIDKMSQTLKSKPNMVSTRTILSKGKEKPSVSVNSRSKGLSWKTCFLEQKRFVCRSLVARSPFVYQPNQFICEHRKKPAVGIEPTTPALRMRCSANWSYAGPTGPERRSAIAKIRLPGTPHSSARYSKILDRFWFSINCGKISTGFKLKKASQPACSQCIEVRRELWREVVG